MSTTYSHDIIPEFRPSYSVEKIGGQDQHIMAVAYVPGPGVLQYVGTGDLVSDCPGSCHGVDCSICSQPGNCYAIRDYRRFPAYRRNCIANTLQLRADMEKHFSDLRATIIADGIETVRYTQSGEIESYDQFLHVVQLAEDLGVEVYLYTKNYPVLYRYFDEGRELPETMTVLISIWGQDVEAIRAYEALKGHAGIKAFVVDNDDYEADATCPAYRADAPGKKARLVKEDWAKCGHCRLCTRAKACKVIRCAKH